MMKVALIIFASLTVVSHAFSPLVRKVPWRARRMPPLQINSLPFVGDAVQVYERSLPNREAYRLNRKRQATLALDGGGARGLITTYILQALEEEIRSQTGIEDIRLCEAFDVVAGTSTGSILATYLTACYLKDQPIVMRKGDKEITLDGSAANATEMYKAFAKDVFGSEKLGNWEKLRRIIRNGYIHSAAGLEKILGDVFENMTLSDLANKTKLSNGREAHVASLLVITYDMTFRRPAMFIADRLSSVSRFLALDPFSRPYGEGGFPYIIGGPKAKRFAKHLSDTPHSENLGDLQAPLDPDLQTQHPMWSKILKSDINVPLARVCRFSSAAPVYLSPGNMSDFFEDENGDRYQLECVDGGLFANVPAQTATSTMYWLRLVEAIRKLLTTKYAGSLPAKAVESALGVTSKQQTKIAKEQLVLSIGCGQVTNKVNPFFKEPPDDEDASDCKDEERPSVLQKLWALPSNVATATYSATKNVATATYSAIRHPRKATGDFILGRVPPNALYVGRNVKDLISTLMSTSSQVSHVNLEGVFAADGGEWDNYLRIQFSANQNPGQPGYIANETILEALDSMDTATDDVLEIYEYIGNETAKAYQPLLREFVRKLLQKDVGILNQLLPGYKEPNQ